jgi:hypothetical protein
MNQAALRPQASSAALIVPALVPRSACKFVHEADSRIKLWVACQAPLYSWHSNQHETNASGIEDRTHLLKACHLQAIGFIHQNESGRVTNGTLLVRVSAADLSERWSKGWQLFGKPIVVAEKRVPVFYVTLCICLSLRVSSRRMGSWRRSRKM